MNEDTPRIEELEQTAKALTSMAQTCGSEAIEDRLLMAATAIQSAAYMIRLNEQIKHAIVDEGTDNDE